MSYSATEIAKKLNISRSHLYQLKDSGVFVPQISTENRILWTDEVYGQLRDFLDSKKKHEEIIKPEYKSTKINNRRFLGNKYKLLPFIKQIFESECNSINTVADVFAGTGAVASAFTKEKVITNDIMYSNYICHVAWFSSEKYSREKISELITNYNSLQVLEDNYMSYNFANTYFALGDCRKIGFIREDIEKRFLTGNINEKERAILITSLLYAMDKIANTCGHYDAYRKGIEYERHLEMYVPEPEGDLNPNNVCYNMDANQLVKEIEADLVYIDPPYNSRQYCDAYHLLENVARWEKPEVFGVAKKMDRTKLKSDYCTQNATKAFEDLIDGIHSRYILLSYNNMAKKGNDRSNAKISDDDIIRILEKKGTIKIFEEDYKAFSTGKSDIQNNKERLFLCKCYEYEKEIIPSALNYTGGKYKLLPQILPHFPKNPDVVNDLFCGGCNVGINVNCNKVIFNDNNSSLMGILEAFRQTDKERIFDFIFKKINDYQLSLVCKNGYEYYGCDSSSGLGKYNKQGFLNLRNDFNKKAVRDNDYYLELYVLLIYSFNNQLRFNAKGEFNLPVGKRDFNNRMQNKLSTFIDRVKSADYCFTNHDFRDTSLEGYSENSFFYVDPPYLITCATYNEQDGWTEEDEKDLLSFLDQLNDKKIKFALSNVLETKCRTNEILKSWIDENLDKYRVINLNYDYSNSNYHAKKKDSITREILVTNY